MRNIAIFVSGEGSAAERIINLFNEGNRLKTVVVIASDTGKELLQKLEGKDITLLYIPDEEWPQRTKEIEDLLRDNHVRLLVLDHFEQPLPESVIATTDGKVVEVSTPEQAPREVVAELESDLRRPQPETVEEKREEKENPTADEEWAEALKIQFTPPKIPMDPPPVPNEGKPLQESSEQQKEEESVPPQVPPNYGNYSGGQQQWNWNPAPNRDYGQYNNMRRHHGHEEPMPSTYLIWSILSTIFCCIIPGIIAIIFSSQVSNRYYSGDIEGAKKASRLAEIWIIVSVVLGVVSATLYLPFMIIGS